MKMRFNTFVERLVVSRQISENVCISCDNLLTSNWEHKSLKTKPQELASVISLNTLSKKS